MSSKSKLRACMLCSFVQTAIQFKRDGCPNCDDILQMKGSVERVMECTSGTFDGTVAMMIPDQSWVSKWQRINKQVPGLYAIHITGTLPEQVQNDIENQGFAHLLRLREDD